MTSYRLESRPRDGETGCGTSSREIGGPERSPWNSGAFEFERERAVAGGVEPFETEWMPARGEWDGLRLLDETVEAVVVDAGSGLTTADEETTSIVAREMEVVDAGGSDPQEPFEHEAHVFIAGSRFDRDAVGRGPSNGLPAGKVVKTLPATFEDRHVEHPGTGPLPFDRMGRGRE